jgi:iron complex outermembrane receptor protein
MKTRTRLSVYLYHATGLCLATPAFAQAPAPPAQPAKHEDEEIVVTARRREELLQDVPISITVYSQQQLDNRNITTATELATYTPSLAANARFGPDKASFALRGFSQIDTTSPTVGVYFADVIALRANPGTTAGNGAGPGQFFDLQTVQVLKGPQGTLFGRNTTGGAILLVPRKPTDKFEGYVEGSIGNYDLRRIQAVLNIPVSDTIRVRFGVDRQKRDGYLHNKSPIGPKDFADSNYISLRGSIVVDVTPNLENYFIGRYSRSNTHGLKLRLIACNNGTGPGPGPAGRAVFTAPLACDQLARQNARGDGFWDVENDVIDPFNILKEWQLINTTTWTASDNLKVKNIISYGEFHERAWLSIGGERLLIASGPNAGKSVPTTIIRNAPGKYLAAQSTFTEEFQLQGASFGGNLNWQAGAYLEISKPLSGGNTTYSESGITCTDSYNFQCEALIPQLGPALGHVENAAKFRNIGFYAQGTYDINEHFAITAGLRYTIDKTVGRGGRLTIQFPTPNNPRGFCANPKILPGVFHLNFDDCVVGTFVSKSSKPTWLIDFDYKPTKDILLYAKYARGYRQGSVNPSNIGVETWRPESVEAYEVGAKLSFHGPVRGYFNAAAFWNDFTNQQLSLTVVGTPQSGIPGARVIVNAGKSRIRGFEIDASVTPFAGFKLDLGYTYLDTKLIEFIPPTFPTPSPFLPFTLPTGCSAATGRCQGIDLPFSPKHRITATATYTLPLNESIGKVSIGATYVHTSSQVADLQSPFGVMPSSDLLNLNLNWDSVAGLPIDLAAFMTNVTNAKFPVNVANNWASNGLESVVTNVPRMYGLRLKYRFGAMAD